MLAHAPRQLRSWLTSNVGQRNLPVKHNPAAKAALLETVNNQITGDEAPEVRTEYHRLLRIGYTEKEARETIAFVLGCHIVATLRTKVPFNYADYLSDLKQLPDCDMDRHFEK